MGAKILKILKKFYIYLKYNFFIMSNEQHIEEILIEAFNLKIYNQVIELSKQYDNLSLSEAVQKAFSN